MEGEEVGAELSPDQLLTRTVVVIGREDRPVRVTAWVSSIGADYVMFHMGKTNTTLIVQKTPQNTLTDDTGKRIHVWEFKGEVNGQTKVSQ